MGAREKILAAARSLAKAMPLDRISLSDIARQSGVSWPTVRRYVGSKEQLRTMLAGSIPAAEQVSPGTRERLLKAAAAVIARRGVAGASLEEIAAEAGMTRGAVYWHYAGKTELVHALIEYLCRDISGIDKALQLIEGEPDPARMVERAMQAVLQSILADLDWPRLYFEMVANTRNPEIRERMQWVYTLAEESVIRRIQPLHDAGLLAPGLDPRTIARICAAITDGLIVQALITDRREEVANLAPQVAALVMNGILRR